MKKLLVLLTMLGASYGAFAFTHQGNWRWRNDDGSETTATWKAAENTSIVVSNTEEVLRLRIELYNNPDKPGGLLDNAILEDSSNTPGATWKQVKLADDNTTGFVFAGSSPNVTDKEATTHQLTSHVANFAAGKILVATEKFPASTVGDNTSTEYEFVIKPSGNLLPSTTYYFRVNAAEYLPGLVFPTLTTGAVLPVKLSSFTAVSEGKFVRLDWSTSSEQSNEKFEVQRSANGSTWETIATLKGKGNTATSASYTAYDNKPILGENYYRLKQFDINGKYATSAVKLVKLFGSANAAIIVSPNPSNASISFSFQNKQAADVVAVLADANGKILHQEKFKNVTSGNINKLSLKQRPAAGIYFLNIYADGIAQSVKVLLQ